MNYNNIEQYFPRGGIFYVLSNHLHFKLVSFLNYIMNGHIFTIMRIRKYFKSHKIYKLNVGSNEEYFEGFLTTGIPGRIHIDITKKIPLPKDSITLTGPVQFKMGRSLYPVVMKHIQGTGAFASKEGAKQATFREEDVLYYSLIAFHGIINPTAAKDSQATEGDINLLVEGMWEGTKNLISRSKFGQMPVFCLRSIIIHQGFSSEILTGKYQ